MRESLQSIRTAMEHSASQGSEPRWKDVQEELLVATSSPPSPEVERLLLAILRFQGELQLDEESEMPHRMSPENMLKSLAVQSLGRWTGATYLMTMQQVQATVRSAPLASVIGATIQRLGQMHRRSPDLEVVAVTDYEEASQTRSRPLGYERDMTFWADRPSRLRAPEFV